MIITKGSELLLTDTTKKQWDDKRNGISTLIFGKHGAENASCTLVKPGDAYHGKSAATSKMHGAAQWAHEKDAAEFKREQPHWMAS